MPERLMAGQVEVTPVSGLKSRAGNRHPVDSTSPAGDTETKSLRPQKPDRIATELPDTKINSTEWKP